MNTELNILLMGIETLYDAKQVKLNIIFKEFALSISLDSIENFKL